MLQVSDDVFQSMTGRYDICMSLNSIITSMSWRFAHVWYTKMIVTKVAPLADTCQAKGPNHLTAVERPAACSQ
jgi:hypothetical protein